MDSGHCLFRLLWLRDAGDEISNARDKHGLHSASGICWSQQQLAERLAVSRQTMNAIERGKHDPSLQLAFLMAALFCSSIESVLIQSPRESWVIKSSIFDP